MSVCICTDGWMDVRESECVMKYASLCAIDIRCVSLPVRECGI